MGLSAHAHNIVQEVQVHGWLLSGIEELTILCCSFLTLVQLTNSKRFGERLSHRLNRKFVRTDDTTQDSEETAKAFTGVKVAITREQSFSLQENVARSL